METNSISKRELFSSVAVPDSPAAVSTEHEKAVKSRKRVVVVLDDDPTGIQTVHGITVYMTWTRDVLLSAFENDSLFYLQTNSRAMTRTQAEQVNQEIMENIIWASRETGKDFSVISRSDSTLRGHYPWEPAALRSVYEKHTGETVDGEILVPFFPEGGRFTANDIHYVQEGEFLTPAGETEFAKDATFGYKSSNLKAYIEEKHEGRYCSEDVVSIPLDLVREMDYDGIKERLCAVRDFQKVVVNALTYDDLKVFVVGLLRAEAEGKRFIFRTAASFVKVYGGISDQPLLSGPDFSKVMKNNGPVLVLVGSHVQKTTRQLTELVRHELAEPIEVNVARLLESATAREQEIQRVIGRLAALGPNKVPVVFTSRELVKSSGSAEDSLAISVRVSQSLVEIVRRMPLTPCFVVAKGGITSSDIAVKGMGLKKAEVLGQVLPGIPVIINEEEGRWPGTPYVIFPGNVGDEFALKKSVDIALSAKELR